MSGRGSTTVETAKGPIVVRMGPEQPVRHSAQSPIPAAQHIRQRAGPFRQRQHDPDRLQPVPRRANLCSAATGISIVSMPDSQSSPTPSSTSRTQSTNAPRSICTRRRFVPDIYHGAALKLQGEGHRQQDGLFRARQQRHLRAFRRASRACVSSIRIATARPPSCSRSGDSRGYTLMWQEGGNGGALRLAGGRHRRRGAAQHVVARPFRHRPARLSARDQAAQPEDSRSITCTTSRTSMCRKAASSSTTRTWKKACARASGRPMSMNANAAATK